MTMNEFTNLSQEHLPRMEAYALQLTKDSNDAKDLIQEAMYNIYKNRKQFQMGSNFRAWSLMIIHNVFVSNYRKQKRRRGMLQLKPANENWSNCQITYNKAEGRIDAEKILKVVHALPEIYRLPFLLRYQGLSYKKIAIRTGVPIGTVKSRVFTARSVLKQEITALYRVD